MSKYGQIKFDGVYLIVDGDMTRKVKIDEIDRVWILINRTLSYDLHINHNPNQNIFNHPSLASTFINKTNYFEIVNLLKLIKQYNPNVKMCSLSTKILKNENQMVMKNRFKMENIFLYFIFSLFGLMGFAFLMSVIFG